MKTRQNVLVSSVALIGVLLACSIVRADDASLDWKPDKAARYLDEREKTWFAFSSAKRGEGATQTTCLSCHSVLGYALARPILRKRAAVETPTEEEIKLLDQTRMRVNNWKKLDTAAFGLLYDFSERKKQESWGTEAVLNTVILAFDDSYQGRSSPSAVTKEAFSHLWKTQVQVGGNKGSWNWLNFNMGPWEWSEAPYFGAALAAIAVGTAPGYYKPGADADTDAKVKLLQEYLKDRLSGQELHNQVWGLWAAAKVEGIVGKTEQKKLIDRLLDRQQDDGGWGLASLGKWVRSDGSAQETASDGYATGLVVHVLQTAGISKQDGKVAKGLDWLKRNQSATGAWRAVSINKKRDPASHTGKFMSDAATAYAVLALSH
jgi:squalene-hopene/tetraprenyl-beta-curcumene cyclase